jgi:hypothetical protein
MTYEQLVNLSLSCLDSAYGDTDVPDYWHDRAQVYATLALADATKKQNESQNLTEVRRLATAMFNGRNVATASIGAEFLDILDGRYSE